MLPKIIMVLHEPSLMNCEICGNLNQDDIKICDKTLNGKTVIDLIHDWVEEFKATDSESICSKCFDLVSRIDELTANLTRAKEDLHLKLQGRSASIVNFSNVLLEIADKSNPPASLTKPSLKIKLLSSERNRIDVDDDSVCLSSITSLKLLNLNVKYFLDDEILVAQSEGYRRSQGQNEPIKISFKGQGNLVCGKCDTCFATDDSLLDHLKYFCSSDSHESIKANDGAKASLGKREFKCDLCSKSFTRKASLQEHIARHKGIRDRECNVKEI